MANPNGFRNFVQVENEISHNSRKKKILEYTVGEVQLEKGVS